MGHFYKSLLNGLNEPSQSQHPQRQSPQYQPTQENASELSIQEQSMPWFLGESTIQTASFENAKCSTQKRPARKCPSEGDTLLGLVSSDS